ncbi:hypothetical protein T10_2006 [Trichinella papuae]|uniref:Secreted protein n=1 Tax=Trichinella papuae TaxID=268474 RepID=A0A0V1ME10_9BILA|nr:hypothetical protein T10_2006 [Trichinella papuae]
MMVVVVVVVVVALMALPHLLPIGQQMKYSIPLNDSIVSSKSMVCFWKILFMHASETVTSVKKKKKAGHKTGQTHSFRLLRQRNAALLNHLHLCTVIRFNEPVITGNFLAECNGLLFKPLPLNTTGRQVQYANQLT